MSSAPGQLCETRFPRRNFLRAGTLALIAGVAQTSTLARPAPFIQTVSGQIPPSHFGFALPHEHVLCDFIGAAETGPHRWDVDAVCRRMLPFLKRLHQSGVTGFVDCTPAFIGRDPRILKRLAAESGLHILTNTGYYGGAEDRFVPVHAWVESAEQLADRWVREFNEGIGNTGVRPGFIKIGIDEIPKDAAGLSAIDAVLVRAAAHASRQTGLTVTCHTGGGPAALQATKLFISLKADPGRFIVAHSDGHGLEVNRKIASLGAWVSFDAISRRPMEEHLNLLRGMIDRFAGQLLLSQDNGWYSAGEPGGGEVRDYNFLPDVFLPACRKEGIAESMLRRLTVENPARAFAIAPI